MDGAVDRELKRGTLEMILLRLLAERPMYGYELVATLEARTAGLFQIKEGTLYPVLYRLEGAGLVSTSWTTPNRGVPRKYYRITEQGGNQLRQLIADWQAFVGTVGQLLSVKEGSHEPDR